MSKLLQLRIAYFVIAMLMKIGIGTIRAFEMSPLYGFGKSLEDEVFTQYNELSAFIVNTGGKND